MTPLSPAAQAVLDAYGTCDSTYEAQVNTLNTGGQRLAAALRAAADRTEGLIGDTPHPKFAEGVLAAGDLLERIAAELDGGTTTPTES